MTEDWNEAATWARTQARADEIAEDAKVDALETAHILLWIFAAFFVLKMSDTVDWPWPTVCTPLGMMAGSFIMIFARAVFLTRREVRRARAQIQAGAPDAD